MSSANLYKSHYLLPNNDYTDCINGGKAHHCFYFFTFSQYIFWIPAFAGMTEPIIPTPALGVIFFVICVR
jgi:hypothetical protein